MALGPGWDDGSKSRHQIPCSGLGQTQRPRAGLPLWKALGGILLPSERNGRAIPALCPTGLAFLFLGCSPRGRKTCHTPVYWSLCIGQAQRSSVTCPRSHSRAVEPCQSPRVPLGRAPGSRREALHAHARPRLTVGLMGGGWSRLEVLLQELSHLLREAGVAMPSDSWAGSGGALVPKDEFILMWGGPSQAHREVKGTGSSGY